MRVSTRQYTAALLAIGVFFQSGVAIAQRHMEKLGRGVVAVVQEDKSVFVGWRLLGTDPAEIAFNIYRQSGTSPAVKLNDAPLAGPTHFIDKDAPPAQEVSYSVRPIVGGSELPASTPFALPSNRTARPYLSVPLKVTPGYSPNDASVADLDGDGEYEIILHQAGRAKDNSLPGVTDPPLLEAYKLDGTLLWRINLGINIRDGAHYTQFMVYDFDGDGRGELICKTADGTTDGQGKVIGDAKANYVNAAGKILTGPEFLTVFDGRTGAAIDTVDYIPPRYDGTNFPTTQQVKDVWLDGTGNRGDRFLACVAYLDGVHPSVVMCRGYYARTVLAAFEFSGGKLKHRWTFDTDDEGNKPFAGQGNHDLSVADVDDDGKDEIVYGGMTVDDNGKGLFTTGYGHGDAIHVGDLDPANPGLEMFRIQERFDDAGAHMVALKTGKTLWKKPSVQKVAGGKNQGPGRGLAADIDPRHPGFESWALGAGVTGIWDAQGNVISDKQPGLRLKAGLLAYFVDKPLEQEREVETCNFRVYWDGDTLDELLDQNQILKWDWEKQTTHPLLIADDCVSNNGTKATPTLSADILGDWREEVIWPSADGKELRIYTTTIPTDVRLYTLMHDPQYRLSIAWQNVGYNQPPHLGFSIEPGHVAPKPSIVAP